MPHDPEPGQVVVQAPAKLNLGLEILGRRRDGYHDLATIFIAIGLFDTLRMLDRPGLEITCGCPSVRDEENLISRAIDELRTTLGVARGVSVDLEKRIPLASGLGGASSDAAAALRGACKLWNLNPGRSELESLALRLGSDVPFFLQGGAAYGTGRGETLESLGLPIDTTFVVVAPSVVIPRKTAALYSSLDPTDFSDGQRIAMQAARLRSGLPVDSQLLHNAFARPLYRLAPDLAELPGLMRAAGAPTVAITGAGPAHYTIADCPARAEHIATNLRQRLGSSADVFVVSPCPSQYHD